MAGLKENVANLAGKCKQGMEELKKILGGGANPSVHVFTVSQNTLGLIYDHGELVEVLQEGQYAKEDHLQKQYVRMDGRVSPILAKNILKVAPYMEANLAVFELAEGQIGIYEECGRSGIYSATKPGTYAWWGTPGRYVWTALDIRHPEEYWHQIPEAYQELLTQKKLVTYGFLRPETDQYHIGLLLHYYKNELIEVISKEGDYIFSNADGPHDIQTIVYTNACLPTYAKEPMLAKYIKSVELKTNQLLLVKTRQYSGDCVDTYTQARTYYFWNLPNHEVEFMVFDTSQLAISKDIIRSILEFYGDSRSRAIYDDYIGRLMDNNCFVVNRNKLVMKYDDVKDACEYQGDVYVWGKRANTKYSNYNIVRVCRSGRQNEPSGPAYTKDKIMVKLAYSVNYTVSDPEKLLYKLFDWNNQPIDSSDSIDSNQMIWDHISSTVFEHIRNEVAKYTLEEFLENRVSIQKDILDSLKPIATESCIEINKIYIGNVGLTKEVQRSMEQVIMAEKKAQVKAIERRDEVAANRSLANTAKLMEDHPSALILRKLQTLEALSEKVGTVNLNFDDKQ